MVIDTECSGLPKNWKVPYSQKDNWPYVVQVAWLIFHWDGIVVKKENFYIINSDYSIEPSARAIHHISDDFLQEKGVPRKDVLVKLKFDLLQYRPIVVGHFVELDYHLLNVEFTRIGSDSPFTDLPFFCTMQASARLPQMDVRRQLRLVDLFRYLFSEEQPFPHNAIYDAEATARCFFTIKEMLPLTLKDVMEQKPIVQDNAFKKNTRILGLVLIVLFILLLLMVGSQLFVH
ncbi:MAG: 3'-5' exonuclease [Pseudopedobacter saltans]|uniref:3'-5' exonuclease n=1 Tax=Pseudopedobacter saltans TaxID=151895 RepID=A0A2W5F4V2_9SPHI|nr:MAG: 3'-5' exonuclease [Pseudopedobacter saltans]